MREGTTLRNRYRLEQFIDRGGMADVYLAFDEYRQVYVALKLLRADLAEDPEFVQRFRREAEALSHLDHPHIVRFYSFEVAGPDAFIVMDYIQGSTLRRHLRQVDGPLPLSETSQYLRQIGSALQYAHNEGFIHRDVKPGNIMLDKYGDALLSDFGIARAAESVTMTMGPLGTPAYMSPEQILGQRVDHRTDIYSLGVVLFEMATGRRPFTSDKGTGRTAAERVRDAHLHQPPPDPSQANLALPAAAAGVILRALAKKPDDRWPDVTSMVRAWEAAVGEERTMVMPRPAPKPEPRTPTPPPSKPEPAKPSPPPSPPKPPETPPKPFPPPASQPASAPKPKSPPPQKKTPSVASVWRQEAAISVESQRPWWQSWQAIVVAVFVLVVTWGFVTRDKGGGRQVVVAPTKPPATQPPAATSVPPTWTPTPESPTATPRLPTATPRPSPTPKLGIGSTKISPKDGMEMVYVPAGEFLMGSPDGEGDYNQHPQHRVYLDAYWIDRTEVTNAQYQKCVAEGACKSNNEWPDFNASDQPMVCVSWYDAQAYCEWAGRHLPTEAEWEKAARGTDGRRFPWGNAWDVHTTRRLNFADKNTDFDWSDMTTDDGYQYTAPAGSYPVGASPYGALDMAGNAREWVADWYDDNYYAHSPSRNPTGPDSGSAHVLRGGSWKDSQAFVRAAFRIRGVQIDSSSYCNVSYGFRCALTP